MVENYIITTNASGVITGFTKNCKEFSIKIGVHVGEFFELDQKSELNWNNFFEHYFNSKNIECLVVRLKKNQQPFTFKPYFFEDDNHNQYILHLEPQIQSAENECKSFFELLTQLSFELLALDDYSNPYKFIGKKISHIFPQCTIIINRYDNADDLFINEYIYSPIHSIQQYVSVLKSHVKHISFSLPHEQKVLATYGRLVELKLESFWAANYFFNKDILKDLLLNIPLHGIYIMGFLSNASLLGNITIFTHQPEEKISMLEPFINHSSLLIQKRHAQHQLHQNSLFYQTILNTTSELIFVVNKNDKIIFANQALLSLLKKFNLPHEILNQNVFECFPFLNHKFIQYLNEAKHQNRTLFFESSSIINQQPIYCQTIITPVTEGWKEHYIVSIRDITDWVLSKKEIGYLTEINQIIIDNLNEGILFVDENYNIIKSNRRFLELYQYDEEQIKSKNIFDLMPQDFQEKAKKILEGLFTEGKTFSHEFTFVDKSGEEKIYYEEIFPILENNKFKFLISITHDITESKKKEQDLLKSKLEAEQKERIKSTFIATISHEIRTPLNSINGFAHLLLKANLNEEKKQHYITQVHNSSVVLLRLIDDLIDLSMIETGNLSIVNEVVFLYPLFHEIYEQFLQELQFRQKSSVQLVLANSPEDNLPFLTDVLRLKQIMSNLISNAIKYTFHGEIKFGYSVLNNCIIFYVKDTGIGIKPEQIDTLFQPFYSLEKGYATAPNSMGLGLYIVKTIVEQMNGSLHVESEWQKGSTFSVRFPYSNINLFTSSKPILKNDTAIDIHKDIYILIAEDDDLNFMFLEEMLSNEKVHIIRARNGKEAVDIFKQSQCQINIVLMDIQMPVMDGFEAIKLIKEINPNIPIIAQTAYAYASEEEQCRRAGCCEYLVKPINQSDLIEKILLYI